MQKTREEIFNELSLGKDTVYLQEYSPSLLKGVPRTIGRNELDISQEKLSFHGDDIWTLYELSWLNQNGVPQVAIGETSFNCDSKNLIESKSFKLYLNSLNQSKFNDWNEVKNTIKNDLSNISEGDVDVTLYTIEDLEEKKSEN